MYLSSDECSDESDSSSTMDSNSDFDDRFKFPPPPRLTKSADISHISSLSDSSNSDGFLVCAKKNKKKKLPPIGIFWDIENCQVPKFKSASAIVQRFRKFFFQYYREAEFLVVCDVKKEHPQVIQELHDSQVNLIHVSAISKNAADEKLRQSLRRFAECHRPPCAIVLISGDVNFAADLSDLRYRKKVRVILVHNANVADALILCANDHYSYQELIGDLPHSKKEKALPEEVAILDISNLPPNCHFGKIKARLKLLVDNCGGRVQEIHRDGRATIRFSSMDFAIRAQKRINGEDVYGFKIRALTPSMRSFSGRRARNDSLSSSSLPAHYSQHEISLSNVSWRSEDNSLPKRDVDCNIFRPILTSRGMPVNQYQCNEMCIPVLKHPSVDHYVDAKFSNRTYATDLKLTNDVSREYSELTTGSDEDSVDLVISNVDSSITVPDLKRALTDILKKYVHVYSLKITEVGGFTLAHVKVSSQEAVQIAISQLQTLKLGQRQISIFVARRIMISDPEKLKVVIVNILQEAPGKHMDLFKFLTEIQSRFAYTMAISEVTKFSEVCTIREDRGCRIISLNPKVDLSTNTSPNNKIASTCLLHSSGDMRSESYSDFNNTHSPTIMVPLKLFADKLLYLLYTHMGSLPLQSFQVCYEQTFNMPLPVDDEGVPLEHMVSCVPGVTIQLEGPLKNIKIIRMEKKIPGIGRESVMNGVSSSLSPAINLFCMEFVDLLKTMDKCILSLDKFVAAYHHHFGRQCRVADYGHTKLMDLFKSLPHIIQIIGIGTCRLLTLAHPAQMKRFTSDLLEILKQQPWKQIALNDFQTAYKKIMKKTFSAVDYGLCTLEDLLDEVPETTVLVTMNHGATLIRIPERRQSPQEILKTKEFSVKVTELLKHSPYFTLHLQNFAPAFYHHFGYQCKMDDCGFTKLSELFEALPDVVEIVPLPNGETAVKLTLSGMFKALGCQITMMLKNCDTSAILLSEFPDLYMREYGYAFKAEVFECETVKQVIRNLSDYVQLLETVVGDFIIPLRQDPAHILKLRLWSLLLDPPYCKEVSLLKHEYRTKFKSQLTLERLNEFRHILSISYSNRENYVSLTRLYILAAQLYHILYKNGHLCYNELETGLEECYGDPIRLEEYNIRSPGDLLKYFGFFIFLSGNSSIPLVSLNKELSDHQIVLPIAPQRVESLRGKIHEKVSIPSLQDLPVRMPSFQTPRLEENGLKDFIPLDHNSRSNFFSAPDAADLPKPDKLISKNSYSWDNSNCSGMNYKPLADTNQLDTSTLEKTDAAKSIYMRFLNFHH